MEEIVEWQSRLLDAFYPIVYLNCIVVKIRQGKSVIDKSTFLAFEINTGGQKEIFGMWIAENEGAKFWFSVHSTWPIRYLYCVCRCHEGLD